MNPQTGAEPQKYVDKYGRIWIRVSEYKVYNPEVGYGTWDNGNGLTPYDR